MLMLIEILVDLRILHTEVRAQIEYLDPLLQQRHGKLRGNAVRERQKGELDAESAQRWHVRFSELEIRQRRAAADPTKNLGGLLSCVLARSKAAKFDQRMFGQALDKLLARITACSKNCDFRFLHDGLRAPSPKRLFQYT